MCGDLSDEVEDEEKDITQMALYNPEVHRFYTLFSKLKPFSFVQKLTKLLEHHDVEVEFDIKRWRLTFSIREELDDL